MPDLFTTDFFSANRKRLRNALGDHPLIVVPANGLLQRTADSSFPFQQDSNFWYLTGLDEPDVLLVMTTTQDYLIVPGRSESRQAFDGAVNDGELAKVSGIEEVLDEQAGWERLMRQLKKAKKLAAPLPASTYIEQIGIYANPARRRFMMRCNRAVPKLDVTDIRPEIARMRMIKQLPELNALQSAIDITIASLEDVIKDMGSFTHEYSLEAAIAAGFRSRGARGHAFEPIVAAGKNACTLHNVSNDSPINRNSLVVMDVGAEVSHYAADITRTVVSGKASDRQRSVYDAVLSVQEAAKDLLKPGVLLKEYEQEVEQLIGEQLRALGLITTNERADIRKYYPHACSHFLGLDVHDVGEYREPLPAGVVMTVEPGIYIPEEGIGVRIEDDVLVTTEGLKVLTAKLARVVQ